MSATTTLVENEQVCRKTEQPERNWKDGSNKFLFWEFGAPLIWHNIILIGAFHFLAVYFALTHDYLKHPGIAVYSTAVGVLSGIGVTGGMHRYWTHRSYKAKMPLRIIFMFLYTMAGQNSPLEWVRDHRVHHKFSETDADPHNSRRGFFYAHVGWLMMRKHPDVIKKGQQMDYSDLFEDPVFVFVERNFMLLKIICCFIVPTIIPPLLWGESWIISIKALCFVRYIIALNYVWLVNSAAHIWGNKPYDKNICPADSVWLSVFLGLGEGYHNYHHTFPWDYRAAELGRHFNATATILDLFYTIGWVYDVKEPSPELVKKMILNNGDGTHYRWGHEVPEEEFCKES